jgi:hypothetical protein
MRIEYLEFLSAARGELAIRLAAANELLDAGRLRDAFLQALRGLTIYLNSDPDWQSARLSRTVDILAQEILDIERGHRSAIFEPPKGKGQPSTTASKNVRIYSPAFVQILRRDGNDLKSAAKTVSRLLKQTGIDVPAERILEWRRIIRRRDGRDAARFQDIVAQLAAEPPEHITALIKEFGNHHLVKSRDGQPR